jgi:hypothetical protein
VPRPPLDPARGADVAKRLRALGVKGILVRAAELGYITEVKCGMPQCFCPEELGGAGYFAPRTNQWNDWEATFEHYPIAKLDGGRRTVDNAVLAHRLCNKLDHFIRHGLSIEKDLERIRRAQRGGGWELMRRAAPSQRR